MPDKTDKNLDDPTPKQSVLNGEQNALFIFRRKKKEIRKDRKKVEHFRIYDRCFENQEKLTPSPAVRVI